MKFKINNRFSTALPADKDISNQRRQVTEACYSFVTPRVPSHPSIVHVSNETANLLGLSAKDIESEDFLKVFSGAKVLEGSRPYAMCYGGHQFGHWAGQLGDGRAINLVEVEHDDKTWALQLKGAGETPYSRRADGFAVLRSSIREHLCSEAMHHLGVPTTRSLSLMLTGDEVMRDMMYDGNPANEKGAVVCRVAPSFIRFGNFEILVARGDHKNLRTLADFTIEHFYPEITSAGSQKYVDFFQEVSRRTLTMIIEWLRVGFVHGVMNTDNMSILGLTIDYGPYGWLDGYEPDWTPNTTDRQHRRYRYERQAQIGLWNLVKLANALYPLVEASEPFEKLIVEYREQYLEQYNKMMARKLGLSKLTASDIDLIDALEKVLQATETDMTLFFRLLSDVKKDDSSFEDFMTITASAFYKEEELSEDIKTQWQSWFTAYQERLSKEKWTDEERQNAMNRVNPKYVLRNYMAQMAIDEANKGNYDTVNELYELLKRPYEEQPKYEKWFAKRPEWARHKVGCSMLSCSS